MPRDYNPLSPADTQELFRTSVDAAGVQDPVDWNLDQQIANYFATGTRPTVKTDGKYKKESSIYGAAGSVGVPEGTTFNNSAIVVPTQATVKAATKIENPLNAGQQLYGNIMNMLPAVERAIGGVQSANAASQPRVEDALVASGEAAANVARIEAEQTIATEGVHAELLRAIGLDVRDPASIVSLEMQKSAGARKKREDLRTRVTELQGINFFADPFGYLAAIPELQSLIPQYNQLVDVENDANAEVARMQSLATTVKSVTPAKSADLLRAKAEAVAQEKMAASAMLLENEKMKNAAGNAKLVLDQFTAGISVFHALLQIEGYQDRQEDREIRRGERAKLLESKIEEKKAQEAAVMQINEYRRMIAGKDITPFTWAQVKAMPSKQREFWMGILDRGNFGDTYAESIPVVNKLGNMAAASNEGNARMAAVSYNLGRQATALAGTIANEHKMKNIGAKALSQEEAMKQAFDKLYDSHRMYATKGADKTDLSSAVMNPYAIDYDFVLAGNTNKNNVVIKVLTQLKQQSPNGQLKGFVTDNAIFSAVQAEVLAGALPPVPAAQQLAQFYRDTTQQQYIDSGLRYFGLPPMQDYRIKPEGSVGSRTVDLWNPSMVEQYFSTKIARKRASEIENRANLFDPAMKGYTGLGTSAFGKQQGE